jgi:hypothetical protein
VNGTHLSRRPRRSHFPFPCLSCRRPRELILDATGGVYVQCAATTGFAQGHDESLPDDGLGAAPIGRLSETSGSSRFGPAPMLARRSRRLGSSGAPLASASVAQRLWLLRKAGGRPNLQGRPLRLAFSP